jgi:hypothetical protein
VPGENLRASTARGCPHGDVLSPLLWNLVLDEFLWGLDSNGCYTIGYADDKAILINGKFPPTAAMEVLLGLPPLYLQVEAEVRIGDYRLSCNDQLKSKSEGFGHSCLTEDMEKNPFYKWGLIK